MKVMYKIEYKDLEGNLLKTAKFNNKQELEDEFYEDREKILIKNEWWYIASKQKLNGYYTITVRIK